MRWVMGGVSGVEWPRGMIYEGRRMLTVVPRRCSFAQDLVYTEAEAH